MQYVMRTMPKGCAPSTPACTSTHLSGHQELLRCSEEGLQGLWGLMAWAGKNGGHTHACLECMNGFAGLCGVGLRVHPRSGA
jgi:hypothetical protein